jgi:hypothetical protein
MPGVVVAMPIIDRGKCQSFSLEQRMWDKKPRVLSIPIIIAFNKPLSLETRRKQCQTAEGVSIDSRRSVLVQSEKTQNYFAHLIFFRGIS